MECAKHSVHAHSKEQNDLHNPVITILSAPVDFILECHL